MGLWVLITPSINERPLSVPGFPCHRPQPRSPSPFGDNLGAEFPAPIPTTANQKKNQSRNAPKFPFFLLFPPNPAPRSWACLCPLLSELPPVPSRPRLPPGAWTSGIEGSPPSRGSPQIQGKPPPPRSLGFFACSSKVHVQGGESAMGRVVG